MAGDELGRARISMIARSISSNTRLDTLVRDHRLPVSQFSLATHGGSIHWGQALSDFPRLRRRHHSRARASLRNRHTGPSIMGFEDEVEQSLGRPCRQTDGRSKQTRKLTSSIVPRGTPFHHLVELEFPPVVIGFTSASCCCSFSGPSELGAISPDAVHNHGQPSSQCNDCLFHPAVPGDLHRPGLEPGPFCRT